MKTETFIDINPHGDKKLIVRNVPNYLLLVELDFEGKKIQVHSADLKKAIENAINNK